MKRLIIAAAALALSFTAQAAPVNIIDNGATQPVVLVDENRAHAGIPANPFISRDSTIEVAKGNVTGSSVVHKFGKAPTGIQATLSDFWPLANAAPTQQIWLAPTAARIHTIASDNAGDTTGGVGTDTVLVTYLPDWDTAEVTVTVTGNLNAGIAMGAAAVMINRMETVPQATSTTANTGTITATAATDTTITALILPGAGSTQQVIYGIPSTHSLLITSYSASLNDNNAGSRVDVELKYNRDPATAPTIFTHKDSFEIQNYGSSNVSHPYFPPRLFTGPGILKVSGIASAADTDSSASIHGILVAN